MKLRHLDDETLISKTDDLVKREREILTQVLHHLREIDRRRLYSSLKYKSLFEYATLRLGYSEDQAYRRIQAMRLLKEFPEIEERISDGSLKLTHLGMAQSLFKRDAKETNISLTAEDKLEILHRRENTTKIEAERVILSHSSIAPSSIEKVRALSAEHFELRFTVKKEVIEQVEGLKGALAHKHPDISLGELFEKLCELGVEKWIFALARKSRLKGTAEISKAQLRNDVFRRDESKCTNCGSHYALELDHIHPKALGGKDTIENMRVLCRVCNQRGAIQVFGPSLMSNYLER